MCKPPPDYDAIEQRMWRNNAQDLPQRLRTNEKNLLKRIATFISRFGFPESDVRDKIRSDDMFASHFAIEPRRQSFHEDIAAEWLDELDEIRNFQNLPSRGKKAYYITSDGEIRQGMKPAPSKSLDFTWITGNTRFYAAHKYTKESGGNQDSQFNEMRSLLEHYMKGMATNTVLIVIVDGAYYTPQRMSELHRFVRTNPPQSFAVPIQDVPSILAEYT